MFDPNRKKTRSPMLEQQAEIVRHRFLADRGRAPPVCPPRDLLPFS